MRREGELPELLAPAGDFACLIAAVSAGADAVYIGGRSFGARAYAKNFEPDEIKRAVFYCHLHGVRLYVAMNTLLEQSELSSAVDFAVFLYEAGVDALIVTDFGLISKIRRRLPEFELHASTQMSVHNSLGADAVCELGCSRVVLARETSEENIRLITERTKAQTEVFLHGALCVCHSGQCLFSSLVGGRSGNRGECAQPCRLPYGKNGYCLSLKDLSLSQHINALIDSGVASLKIEGRMKSPDYVYTVTSIYRRLLDGRRSADKAERARLKEAFSRGEFTDGYFTGRHGQAMTGIRSEEDKNATRKMAQTDFSPKRTEVTARVKIKLGEPSEMTLAFKNRKTVTDVKNLTAQGKAPEIAISAPLEREELIERLSKMGASLLSLSPLDIELELDGNVNLSKKDINELRRTATALFEGQWMRKAPKETEDEPQNRKSNSNLNKKPTRTAIFYEPKELEAIEKSGEIKDYFEKIYLPINKLGETDTRVNGAALPPVVMEDELDEIRKMLRQAKERGVKYVLCENISQLALVKEIGLIADIGFRFNVTNSASKELVLRLGAEDVMLSAELTDKKARDIGGRVIVYGRIPLMITERCFVKENFGCGYCNSASLKDRKGASFPIIREFRHRNLILNSAVTYMADKSPSLYKDGLSDFHFIFTKESHSEIIKTITCFKEEKKADSSLHFRRMGRRDVEKSK